MILRSLGQEEALPVDLLLLADPSEEMLGKYLEGSEILVAESGANILGVCVIYAEDGLTAEIKNIAVSEEHQGKGIGRSLLNKATLTVRAKGFKNLVIGTGDTGYKQIRLYQSAGFEISDVKKNFFVDHYPEPLYENGNLITDMIILSKPL
ncbi:GNAT family N-acetyltransferase [Emticicia sp. CRIBPO]|uniref:GNAT family N-acetyltransferase n=1 Tax=Emticicia sp. CRIBPO TaxID=2683258 RepID=UPI001412B99A|nr:GNAT family N-acetyltransferase [Emticicia sp. CRIBPO]NBA87809.1 GNAT family N-acetyltransferase [Emticicia sp. CRIBPO]